MENDDCAYESGDSPNQSLCGCDSCEASHPSDDYDGPVPQEWIIDRD